MARLSSNEIEHVLINELVRAASKLRVPIRRLSPEEVMHIRSDLSDRFGDGEHLLTFENMRQKSSIQDENGWSHLRQFLRPGAHVMFYDAPGLRDRGGIELEDGNCIPDLIGECFGFPFYVTDAARTFVVGMNEHDYLIGTGTATHWINSLRRE